MTPSISQIKPFLLRNASMLYSLHFFKFQIFRRFRILLYRILPGDTIEFTKIFEKFNMLLKFAPTPGVLR